MLPACFRLAESVFPRVRAEAARGLVADGWSQNRAAKALGVSQAMVSKYLGRSGDTDPVVRRLAQDLIHQNHGHETPGSWCGLLTELQGDADREALDDLLEAEALLMAQQPLAVMPQIGLNLARAPAGTTGPEQILAYPARMVRAGTRILRPSPPAAGGSQHLARCLLSLRGHDPSTHAVANVRGGPDIDAALSRLGWHHRVLPPGDDVDARFHAVADAETKVFHDPGALGIEPCLYLAGPDARAVAHNILILHEALQ